MNVKTQCHILVVDDEPAIVNAVRRELAAAPVEWFSFSVEGFTDPHAAIERAREKQFDAAISDYRMPEMDGVQFLNALALIQPDCARLVLSGQTDMDGLIRMVNENHIYRFIAKPWQDMVLKSSLASAIEYARGAAEHRRLAGLVAASGVTVPAPEKGEFEQVLVVDDDPAVLARLARILTHHQRIDDLFAAIRPEAGVEHGKAAPRYSVRTTESPADALQMARDERFSCVIAGCGMQKMSGTALLKSFLEIQPDCVRLLIDNQISQTELVDAIASAQIFGLIEGGARDFEIKAAVAQALGWRRLKMDNQKLAGLAGKH
jgi:DNA-binding NtrC family response regulator